MREPNESTIVQACIGRDGTQLTKRLACVHKKMLRDASAHLPGCMMSVEFTSDVCGREDAIPKVSITGGVSIALTAIHCAYHWRMSFQINKNSSVRQDTLDCNR